MGVSRSRKQTAIGEEKIDNRTNQQHLIESIDALAKFLSRQGERIWAERLTEIRAGLATPQSEAKALFHLGEFFGGMGSLNDLVMDDAEKDTECGLLLDAVFRDFKLFYATPGDRLAWKQLEQENKEGLPPRIRHAFHAP